MTIRFSPHTKEAATEFFAVISNRIDHAQTDVLFAVMKDDSASAILKAIKAVRDGRDDIFFLRHHGYN
jgi:folylpolyglutamate synthase/dihydropteroate synthase